MFGSGQNPWFPAQRCRPMDWDCYGYNPRPQSSFRQQTKPSQPKRSTVTTATADCHPRNLVPKPGETLPKCYKTRIDLSRFNPDDISVKLDDNVLMIRVEGDVVKRLNIPANALTDKIKCSMDQFGELQIEIPIEEPRVDAKKKKSTEPKFRVEMMQPEPKSVQPKEKTTESPKQQSPVKMETDPDVIIEDLGPF